MVRIPAWEGDIEQRLTERLRARDFSSATAYAATQPTASLLVLADELGRLDVAAVQLERRLYAEAIATHSVERFARDLFVRLMHEHLPEGWHRDWGPDIPGDMSTPRWRGSQVRSGWAASIDAVADYKATAGHMMRALRDEAPFPEGWIPRDADDPLLVDFFSKHWPPSGPTP